MKPKGELIGISPGIIELSDDDVQKHNAPQVISPDTPTLSETCIALSLKRVSKVLDEFSEAMHHVALQMKRWINANRDTLQYVACIAASPDSRMKHLAQYSKKHRVRKKNIARLKKEFAKHHNRTMSSCEFVFSEKEAPEDVWVRQNTQGDCEYDSNNY